MKKILPIILLLVFSLLVSCSIRMKILKFTNLMFFKEYKLSMINGWWML